MAYEIVNKLRGPSFIRFVDTGAVTINLSQLSVAVQGNTNVENVYSAIISSVRWSTNAGGSIAITRQNAGSPPNTILTMYGSGDWPHDDVGLANSATGNLTITATGGALSTCIVVLKKQADYNVSTQF